VCRDTMACHYTLHIIVTHWLVTIRSISVEPSTENVKPFGSYVELSLRRVGRPLVTMPACVHLSLKTRRRFAGSKALFEHVRIHVYMNCATFRYIVPSKQVDQLDTVQLSCLPTTDLSKRPRRGADRESKNCLQSPKLT